MIAGGSPLEDFGFTVGFGQSQVVLGIRGEIDQAGAGELAAVLDAIVARGHVLVVLDLAELTFMDAAGLGVIVTRANQIKVAGGELRVRSAPVLFTRILEITGMRGAVRLDPDEPASGELDRQRSAGPLGVAAGSDVIDLARHLERVRVVPADHDVVDGTLRLVVALAQAAVEGADGVSVSLQRHGRLTTVAASDQTVLDMDAEQYATREGPCVDASVEGRWFHAESLDRETRWPTFVPRAQGLGIRAILSNPLMAGDRPVGALNIYSRTRAAFSDKQRQLASIFATEASVILEDAGTGVSDDQLAQRVRAALGTRQIIALAQGVVMERDGISEEDAYARLRVVAQKANRPLGQRAADVVDSTRRRQSGVATQIGDA